MMRGMAVLGVLFLTALGAGAQERGEEFLVWKALPGLPVSPGSAPVEHPVLGVSGRHLVIVGWSRIAPDSPAEAMVFLYRREDVRTQGRSAWGSFRWSDYAGDCVAPVGGVTASTPEGMVIVGVKPVPTATLFSTLNGTHHFRALAPPPFTAPVVASAAIDRTVFIGCAAAEDGSTRPSLYSLEVSSPGAQWRELGTLPSGTANDYRLAAQGGALYLLANPLAGSDHVPGHMYRFRTGGAWQQLADTQLPSGPAVSFGKSQAHILFPAGDRTRAYHTITDTWANLGAHSGELTGAADAGAAVAWEGGVVLMPRGVGSDGSARCLYGTAKPRPSALFWPDYAALIVYFVGMAGIGAYFARAQDSTNRFFLGGRRVPWWAVGISIFGTAVSSITYLSIPAKAYATDWVFILASTGTLLMAPLVTRYYLPHYRRWPITTAYEYLERRFNFASRLYGSAIFLSYQIGRVGIVLFLPSICLSAATGIDLNLCILLMGLFSTLYTVMGGIEAVIWTDVVQSFVLLGGAFLVLFFAAAGIDGGFPAMVSTAWDAGKMHTFTWSWDATIATVWVCIVGNFFATSYPMTADQTIVQRYLTTATEQQAARAIWTNALLSIPTSIVFFGLGSALWVYFRSHPEQLDPNLQPDAIMPLFIAEQLPAGVSGLVLAAVFAAAMSTLSSSINSVASVLVNDYYRRLRPALSEKETFKAARWISAAFGAFGTALALLMARLPIQSLLDVFYQFLSLVGGGLGGLVALGVFTRRANGIGGLVGVVASAAALYFVQERTSLHFFLYGAIGFLTTFVVGYVASLPFPAPKVLADEE